MFFIFLFACYVNVRSIKTHRCSKKFKQSHISVADHHNNNFLYRSPTTFNNLTITCDYIYITVNVQYITSFINLMHAVLDDHVDFVSFPVTDY